MIDRTSPLVLACSAALLAAATAGCGRAADRADTPPDLPPPAAENPAPAPDTSNGPDRWRITPHGIGPVMIGVPLADVATAIGASPDIPPAERECGYVQATGAPAGVIFMVRDGIIARVDVREAGVLSGEGIGIGATEAEVKARYGAQVTQQPHKYTDGHYLVVRPMSADSATHRLVFVTDGSVVTSMHGGRLPEAEWVEGCS